VAPDRPGCGRSTPAPQRGIAGWPADHAALLDALGAQRAGILSQSGGTPYAIAVAAALAERTIALAALGPVAPFDEPASVRELGGELRTAVRLARHAPWLLAAMLRAFSRAAAQAHRLAALIGGGAPVHVVPETAAFGLVQICAEALRFATASD